MIRKDSMTAGMKKAAVINDLSGLGKCSLVADISVLSAMGVQACPVPTAVLTAQTGYETYLLRDMTELMTGFTSCWSKMGQTFDGILTGFFLNAKQAEIALDFAERFAADETVLLVDPVMGDRGKCYKNFSGELLEAIGCLVKRADIITPNITELALLCGEDPAELVRSTEMSAGETINAAVRETAFASDVCVEENMRECCFRLTSLARSLIDRNVKADRTDKNGTKNESGMTDETVRMNGTGRTDESGMTDGAGRTHEAGRPDETGQPGKTGTRGKTVLVTGIPYGKRIGTLLVTEEEQCVITAPREPGGYSGTGDLFAAAVLGGTLLGKPLRDAVSTACDFLSKAVASAAQNHVDANDGTDYEEYLSLLVP